MNNSQTAGALLRQWRQRRRLSQLDLACEAEISTRHLSFVETGRAQPSRDMLLHLAEQLDMPLRERNRLLGAAGYAPLYSQHDLADPALAPARQAIEQLLKAHEPYPALAIDRQWNLLAANAAVGTFIADMPAFLLGPPLNVMRLSLHPEGLAPRIANLAQWHAHLLMRLQRDAEISGDEALFTLLDHHRIRHAERRDPGRTGAGNLLPRRCLHRRVPAHADQKPLNGSDFRRNHSFGSCSAALDAVVLALRR
jgi:transcriptional regulator with XRE-family HTH domain